MERREGKDRKLRSRDVGAEITDTCFFEKLRIFNDQPKSEARLANEQKYVSLLLHLTLPLPLPHPTPPTSN